MHNFYIVVGPSGGGKTTIVNTVTKNKSITSTSRVPRENEVEGRDYYFKTRPEFEKMIKDNQFIEWAEYGSKEIGFNYYGLTEKELNRRLNIGDVFNICDIQGAKTFKELYPDAIIIFIYADKTDTANQLDDRGGEKTKFERLSLYESDMEGIHAADYVIKNEYGKLEESIMQMNNIINKHKR